MEQVSGKWSLVLAVIFLLVSIATYYKVNYLTTLNLNICLVPFMERILPSCRINSILPNYSEIETYNLCMLQNQKEEARKLEGFFQHGFNEYVSEKIGLVRAVPNVKHPACFKKVYSETLPTASIVMCFYNEAWSTLLRSVHSVISQTPSRLLKEIILVDDNSSLDHLKEDLEAYIDQNFTNVKLIRSKERLGLIRARMEGAKHATGEILVFLDSHIEAGDGWLEPLLDRIAKDRTTVVVPVVDTIEAETMIYRSADIMRGGFTWSLMHNWEPLPLKDSLDVQKNANPFLSPTMPGGLFAMERNYFYELGEYDSEMEIWGGENMEISFRIWQCGGRLEIVPCSRVAHVFRQFRPYAAPDGKDTATVNSARVAEVWLDEYKKHFYDLRPLAKSMDIGNIDSRVELRKRLNCKSFKWFLENIHPEQFVPGEKAKVPNTLGLKKDLPESKVKLQGDLIHTPSGLCIRPQSDPPAKEDFLLLTSCHNIKKLVPDFLVTEDYQIKLRGTRFCLETKETKTESTSVNVMKCHSSGGAQTWIQKQDPNNTESFLLFNPASGKCLSAPIAQKEERLKMKLCSYTSAQLFTVQSR
ncbi:polypeptide N-acetylgalactosaminyltransferase 11-like [Physella acuta]|uniref:polypeptide N-acetylgalactosaminyltransferase 11-like n=1 Tax=Physella acuta TaxID=109671 RepID=UPI0027DD410C|nr:polypeptide N-acetylgalactosaminyltransferase 11-like [Physella acuta]